MAEIEGPCYLDWSLALVETNGNPYIWKVRLARVIPAAVECQIDSGWYSSSGRTSDTLKKCSAFLIQPHCHCMPTS
jgi:hypothetical protein